MFVSLPPGGSVIGRRRINPGMQHYLSRDMMTRRHSSQEMTGLCRGSAPLGPASLRSSSSTCILVTSQLRSRVNGYCDKRR